MKAIVGILTLVLILGTVIGCENDDIAVINPYPEPPQGVTSITADEAVELYWTGPYVDNIDYYIIWRSFEEFDNYTRIATVDAEPNPDIDLIYYAPGYIDYDVVNGETYFYAISSVDFNGRVSDLSAESVFDTPRPEGTVTIYDRNVQFNWSGYRFDTGEILAGDNADADVFIESSGGVFYLLEGRADTDIQDMGYTYDFSDVGWAPYDGWSQSGQLEIIEGHTYVVWTADGNFAKLRVEDNGINLTSVDFEWAYQTDYDNPELAPPLDGDSEDREYSNAR